MSVLKDSSVSVQQEQVTVEFSVELEKWQSASEAQQLLHHHQNSKDKWPVLS